MMKKNLLWILALGVAMVGCSENDPIEPREDDPVEIVTGSSVMSIDATNRAAYEGNDLSTNPLSARVIGVLSTANYGARWVDGNIIFTDATQFGFEDGYEGQKYYPVNGDDLNFVGLYPYAAATNKWGVLATNTTPASTTASFEFNGSEDVMAAANVVRSKNDIVVTATNPTPDYPTLAFKHLLTKLDILIKAESEAAVTAWGDINKIEVLGAQNKVEVTLLTGAAETGTTAFSGSETLFCYLKNTNTAIDANNKVTLVYNTATPPTILPPTNPQAYVIVAPKKDAGGAKYKLKVYTDKYAGGQEVVVKLKNTTGTVDESGDTQGKSYTVTLTFKATEIEATATVTKWEPGGSAGEDIQ